MEGRKLIAIYSNGNSNGTEQSCGTQVGAFYAPTNPIPEKAYTEAVTKLRYSFVALNRLNITPDGKIEGKASKNVKAIFARAEQRIYAIFDELLGYEGAAKGFFNTLRPFAKVKGKFYCEQCFDIVRQYVDFKGGK